MMKKDDIKSILIVCILGPLLTIFIVYGIKNGNKDRAALKDHGMSTKAIIVDVKTRKGTRNYKYEFYVNYKKHIGWENLYSEGSDIGDTIVIVYLPEDPSVNRAKSKLDEYK